tara:strand:- start:454 stop:1161 length:708 start_codon:yes stop_codon:yes gene_type:complete
MTQQKIYIDKSSKLILDSFIKHVKFAIFSEDLLSQECELDYLHNIFTKNKRLIQGTDQSTLFHKAVYSSFDQSNYSSTEFFIKYKELCLAILIKLKNRTGYFGEWAIQRFPTFRFQFPDNVSVFEFHRDSDYSHPIGEINCFYAINECLNSSSLQVEKNLGYGDYEPLNLKPGEYALLNTSIFKHGDILNKTNRTRVSMDFRFIPVYLLMDQKKSLTMGKKFTADSYFMSDKEFN